MDLDRLSDEELIETARRDASSADACLAVLYRRYYPKVAAWCLRIGGDRQEAADLAQEVFLRVHERLDGFPAAPAAGARPRRMPAQAWKLAAAVVLLLGGGLLFRLVVPQGPGAPPLPAPEIGGPVRGGEIEALSPLGDAAGIPSELRWNPRPGAASYRVRLLAVDDTVLWETTVPASPAKLPAEVQGKLQRAVSYLWTVEALDASGARLASSETVRFRIRP